MAATTRCYVGIDVGTQGLTALLVESSSSSSLNVLALGEGSYDFVPDLPDGCYEQDPLHWENALVEALGKIQNHVEKNTQTGERVTIEALCVTGQMHGCVMIDRDGKSIGTARLWCDARNQEEADELSQLFGEKMPKRLTAARYLWSLKHEPEKTEKCVAITTPAGYIAHRLTTAIATPTDSSAQQQQQLPPLLLGVGEASGMFPVRNAATNGCEYRNDWIVAFDGHVRSRFPNRSIPSVNDLLPRIRSAGDLRTSNGDNSAAPPVVVNQSVLQTGGWLHEVRGLLLESNSNNIHGILVAPAEGDQPTALAASLIGQPGMISCSFGTSVVANMVGKGSTSTKKPPSLAAVDKFNAVNGQPISMVWLRNGTTYLNRMVDSYGGDFESLLKQAVDAPADCGGLLALPFLDDEPGLNVTRGGTGMIVGFTSNSGGEEGNHKAGNVIKAAIVSVMFNLYIGTQQVEEAAAAIDNTDESSSLESVKREIVLTGGLTKTPETGQMLADIFDRPVRLLEAADEGGAWGAALLAKYYHDKQSSSVLVPPPEDWLSFLNTIKAKEQQAFYPHPERVETYRSMLEKYKKLLQLQPQLDRVMNVP